MQLFVKGIVHQKNKRLSFTQVMHFKPDFFSSARCTRKHLKDVSNILKDVFIQRNRAVMIPLFNLSTGYSKILDCILLCQVTGNIEAAHFMYENP